MTHPFPTRRASYLVAFPRCKPGGSAATGKFRHGRPTSARRPSPDVYGARPRIDSPARAARLRSCWIASLWKRSISPRQRERGAGLGLRRSLAAIFGAVSRNSLLWADKTRSEEHTSELQSLMRSSYEVFCLEKKINRSKQRTTTLTQIKTRTYSN